MTEAQRLMPDIAYAADPYACVIGADAVVILTEWNSFRALDLARLGDAMSRRIMVDLRNVYGPTEAAANNFRYVAVGR